MKCPDCGKVLKSTDILVPVFDKSGKNLVFCFHVDERIFRNFMESLEVTGESFESFMKKVAQEIADKQ